MSDKTQLSGPDNKLAQPLLVPIKRRSFFMYAGATAGATALLLSGCDDDDDDNTQPNLVSVGSGDVGVLNYAYALEQLEAAFYQMVVTGTAFNSFSAAEKSILQDIRDHELAHRDFFKTAITGAGATPLKPLEPDFSAINMNDKAAILGAAKTFEDLGVAAYNGAGKFLTSPIYLGLAGKIVSVEARHAAIIRDLISEGSFVDNDVVDIMTTGLERSKEPSEVATAANTYLKAGSKIDVSGIR